MIEEDRLAVSLGRDTARVRYRPTEIRQAILAEAMEAMRESGDLRSEALAVAMPAADNDAIRTCRQINNESP